MISSGAQSDGSQCWHKTSSLCWSTKWRGEAVCGGAGGKKLGKSGDDGIQSELGKLGSAWSDQAFPLHRPGMHSFLERSSICAIF